jgi:hypothetical protein
MNLDLNDDAVLLSLLSIMLDRLDPVPPAASRAAMAACELRHVDRELVMLVADTASGEELLRDDRGGTPLTFECSQFTVEIEIDAEGHAVGVLSPPAVIEIAVEMAAKPRAPSEVSSLSDELGRFQIDLGHGLCRLRIGSGTGAVATSWFYA